MQPPTLQRPDGTGISKAKVTAIVTMLWPFIEPYLTGSSAIPLDAETIHNAGPYILLGLAVWFIRRAIPQKVAPADFSKILDGYERMFREREALRHQVMQLRANSKPATVPSQQEDQPPAQEAGR